MSDPKVRRAVERQAVDLAVRYYTELAYVVEDVGNFRSYELQLAVGLTANEVTNANDNLHLTVTRRR